MLIFYKKLNRISKKIDKLAKKIESRRIAEYVDVLDNTKALLWKNFVIGISKGIGIAIGVSLFGALTMYLLRKIVMLNLPVIGAFIKEIINIVEQM